MESFDSGTSGDLGHVYETLMCMLFFVRGFIRNIKQFKLGYQITEAGKFDDVLFFDGKSYEMFQLKHTESRESGNKLTDSDLFSNENKGKGNYNLLKYVKAFTDKNSEGIFKDKINCVVVFTNADIDTQNNRLALDQKSEKARSWYGELESVVLDRIILNKTAIFRCSHFDLNAKYYKFVNDKNIINILQKQAKSIEGDFKKLTIADIQDALKYIIYAVAQPNSVKLKEIVKDELRSYLKFENIEEVYNKFESAMKNWCDTKTSIFLPNILFKDAQTFFQHFTNPVVDGLECIENLQLVNEKNQ